MSAETGSSSDAGCTPARDLAEQPLAHRGADVTLAAGDLAQRTEKVRARDVLHDITADAEAQQALGVQRFVLHRQHQHAHVGMIAADPAHQVDAVVRAERQVDDGDVGLLRRRLPCCASLTDDASRRQQELALPGQQLLQALADERMIVDDDDPCLFCHGCALLFGMPLCPAPTCSIAVCGAHRRGGNPHFPQSPHE